LEFKIPDEIVGKSTDCMYRHACLANDPCDEFPKCLIKYPVSENILMLQRQDMLGCPYCTDFGSGHFCSCPVRYAIFRSYNI